MWRVHVGPFKEGQEIAQCPGVAPGDPGLPTPVHCPPRDEGNEVCENGSFLMKMDAQGFAPEELCVQVDGQNLTVMGERHLQHCDPNGGGFLMRHQVHQQVQLPPELDPTSLTCNMSPSGHLCFHSPCRPPPSAPQAQANLARSPGIRRQGPRRVHH